MRKILWVTGAILVIFLFSGLGNIFVKAPINKIQEVQAACVPSGAVAGGCELTLVCTATDGYGTCTAWGPGGCGNCFGIAVCAGAVISCPGGTRPWKEFCVY